MKSINNQNKKIKLRYRRNFNTFVAAVRSWPLQYRLKVIWMIAPRMRLLLMLWMVLVFLVGVKVGMVAV